MILFSNWIKNYLEKTILKEYLMYIYNRMESIKEARQNPKYKKGIVRPLSESSWATYKRNITQLSLGITGEPYVSNDFVLDTEPVIAWLDSDVNAFSLSKKKLLLSVILIILSPNKYDPNLSAEAIASQTIYKLKLLNIAKVQDKVAATKKKSEKQDINWVEWKEILAVENKLRLQVRRTNYKSPNKQAIKLLEDHLIVALYTLLPPRRLDYAGMLIISHRDYKRLLPDEREKNNFLVDGGKTAAKKFFSYGRQSQKSKNIDRNGVEQSVLHLPVPKPLNKIINAYLKYHPEPKENMITRHLLLNNKGKGRSKDNLSKKVMEIFSKHIAGKVISPTLLRSIYISNTGLYSTEVMDKKKSLAESMGHSINVANTYYAKE